MRAEGKISHLELRLLSGAAWSLLGAGIGRALLLGASVVSGRVLGVESFGKLGMVQSTSVLLGTMIGASLSLATTELVARTRMSDPVRAGGVIVKAYRLALACGAAAAVLVALFAGLQLRFLGELRDELRLGAALALFGALNAVQGSVLAGLDGFRPLAFASVARGIASFLLIALGAWSAGLHGAIAGQILAELLSAVAFHAAIAACTRAQGITLSPTAAPGSLRSLTGIALPTLLGTVALQPVLWCCNVLLVSGGSGFSELGLFNAAERWRQLLLFVPASLSANVLSALSRLNGAGDAAGFRRIFRRSLALMLLVVLVPAAAVMLYAPLCLAVFGPSYRSGALALVVLAASSIPNALNNTLGQVLITRGKVWWRFCVDLGLVAILMGSGYALIPAWGAVGLAAANLLAYGGAVAALAAALRWSAPLWRADEPAPAEPSRKEEGPRLVHVATVPEMLVFLRGQIGFMQRAGFSVGAIASPEPALALFGTEQRMPTWALPMARRISPLRDLVSLVRLIALLRRVRPTILHAHTPKGGLLGMLAGAAAGVPVRIYHLHGLPLETARGFRRALLKLCDRVACGLAHRVLAVSPSLLEAAVAHGLVSREKATVPANGSINGVDADREFSPEAHRAAGARVRALYGIPPDAPVAGFVGRLVRDKGVLELAEAWQAVRRRHPGARLLIVGPFDGTDPVPPRTMALLKKDPSVTLVGPDWEVGPYMAAMDLLVLPTYREGLGNVLLEAGAMELPVVATRITGCVDAVEDGRTGTLVPPRDAGALAGAISAYLGSADLRARHGAAARERVVRRFSQEVVWRAMHREYEAALRLRRVGGPMDAMAVDGREGRAQAGLPALVKAAIDRGGAALGLLLLAPVLAAIALLIRAQMGTPAFFRQVRPGKGGRPFRIVKFRTMLDTRDARGQLLPDEQRLTAFGRFLRSTSLDELPQLWNVLRGELSLVGPRPLVMQYLDRYSERQARRHEVMPGITGWSQINGRNALSWDEKLELDVWYVEHWSLRLDLKILALTAGAVLARKGVSNPGHATMPDFMGSAAPRRLP